MEGKRKIIRNSLVIILIILSQSCMVNKASYIKYTQVCNEYQETEKDLVLENLFKDLKKRKALSFSSIWYSLNSLEKKEILFSKDPPNETKCISKEMKTLFSIWLISKGIYKQNCSEVAYLHMDKEIIYDLKMNKESKVSLYNKERVDKIKKEYFLWYKKYLQGDTSLYELSVKYDWVIVPAPASL